MKLKINGSTEPPEIGVPRLDMKRVLPAEHTREDFAAPGAVEAVVHFQPLTLTLHSLRTSGGRRVEERFEGS